MEEIVEAMRCQRGSGARPPPRIPGDLYVPQFAWGLLNEGRYIDERNPQNGHTALHDACERGSVKLVKLLLRQDADPAVPTKSSRVNAVHLAAIYNHPMVLRAIRTHLEDLVGTAGSASWRRSSL